MGSKIPGEVCSGAGFSVILDMLSSALKKRVISTRGLTPRLGVGSHNEYRDALKKRVTYLWWVNLTLRSSPLKYLETLKCSKEESDFS